jgi:predicted amino acid dehydrogenase
VLLSGPKATARRLRDGLHKKPSLPRFVFLVHALTPAHKRILGARFSDPELMAGGKGWGVPGRLCRIVVEGLAIGEVISLPLLPEELLTDQEGALGRMEDAIRRAEGPVAAVGLGSVLAVVAGRGEALAERVNVPVTTGAAATSWAALGNTLRVHERLGGPIAVLGASGTVGDALVEALCGLGHEVIAGGAGKALERRCKTLGAKLLPEEEAAGAARVVVGAATTGGTLAPEHLQPHSVLIDVALPPTLQRGPLPPGVVILAGEAVDLPRGWTRGLWGQLYHLFAGYGPQQIFACLAEPMVMAIQGRTTPFALGRRLKPGALIEFTEAARELGLTPRLARGWREARLDELPKR